MKPCLLLSAIGLMSAAPLVSAAEEGAQASTPANSPVLVERKETAAEHDARMAWFRTARFGMFVHWGLYAQAGGEWNGKPAGGAYGEWIMNHARIPLAEYAKLAKDFNPAKYDAEAWVLAAKDAGMNYIVITAKHHEGFAMFASKASPYNIVDATPYKRDPLKDLVAACRKHGMKIGFYYSQNLDWHHPGGGGGDWDPAHKGDPDQYVDQIVIPQVREILTNYGKIDILWWDIPGGVINKSRADRIQQVVLECNPTILMNNRLGGGYHGDTETPEQFIPATGFPGRDWETCMTMNHTWGYKKHDHAWKDSKELIRMLCNIASKGGNFLLNVGPTELGEIPQPSLDRMKEVGLWTKKNGEAIYGTSASPFPRGLPWGYATVKGNKMYLSLLNLPSDRQLKLPGLKTKVKSAYFLTDPTRATLPLAQSAEGLQTITVPQDAPLDPAVTIIVAELEGAPVMDASIALMQSANAKGGFDLKAVDATISGALQLEGEKSIGYWTKVEDTITWRCQIPKPGAYRVTVDYACADDSAGSEVLIMADGSRAADGSSLAPKLQIKGTGGWQNYRWSEPVTLTIPKTGPVTIELKAATKPHLGVMNVREVRLEPVSQE